MDPKRILLIRTDRIGDVVLSTPAIKALREAYPSAYIAFMARPYARDIVAGNPYLEEVIIYDKYGKHKNFISTIFFALNLRKKRFDTAFILHPTNRAHMIAFLSGIPNRIGLDRKMAALLTKRIKDKKFLGEKHELDYTLDVLKSVGVTARDRKPYVPVSEQAINSINAKLAHEGYKSAIPVIAVHPGASCPSKRWPPERFAELIGRIKERYNFQIAIIAGPDDIEEAEALLKGLKVHALNLAGKTTVGELAAFFKKCILFISNDSGPVHIASAVGTPSVVVFGRKQPGLSPKRWGPIGEKDVFIQKDAGCGICLAHNCVNGFKCLKMITTDDVFEVVSRMISSLQTA